MNSSPLTSLIRLFARRIILLPVLLCAALSAYAQPAPPTIYYVQPSIIGANAPGATLTLEGVFPSAPAAFCFYTGFGDTTPIVGQQTTIYGSPAYIINVKPSTIQQIPKASFGTSGTFQASIYAVTSATAACTNAQAQHFSNVAPASITVPTLTSIDIVALPEHNPNISGVTPPTELYATGNGFIAATTATVTGNFPTFTAAVTDLTINSLKIDAPIVPIGQTTLTIQLCNNGPVANYCTAATNFTVNGLAPNPGTLSATLNAGGSYDLEADFGLPAGDTAGLPVGSVTFKDGASALGSAPAVVTQPVLIQAARPSSWTSGQRVGSLLSAVADFNKDGLPDTLVFDPATPNVVHLLLGANNRGDLLADFPISVGYSSGCGTAAGISVADLNNDGYPDFVLLCTSLPYGSQLYTFINQGDGTFAAATAYLNSASTSVATGDTNKDGKIDVILSGNLTTGSTSNGFVVMLGDGLGGYSSMVNYPAPLATGQQLLAGDLNNDGYVDLIVRNVGSGSPGVPGYTPASISIFLNDGTGKYASTPVQQLSYGLVPAQVFLQKVAGSAYPNLIFTVTSGTAPQFDQLQNSTQAANPFPGPTFAFYVPNLTSATLGDFNADGTQDVATFDGVNLKVFYADATGLFSRVSPPPPNATLAVAGLPLATLAGAGDFNSDGYQDVVAVTPYGGPNSNAKGQAFISSGTVAAKLPGQTFAPGIHALTATTPGTAAYAPGTATQSLTIAKPTPTVLLSVAPPGGDTFSPTSLEVLTATVRGASGAPTGTVSFYDFGEGFLGSATLSPISSTTSVASLSLQLVAATHSLSFQYGGDSSYYIASTNSFSYTVLKGTPVVSWTPNPASIPYGTALSSAQLDATDAINGSTIPGTFTYNPPAGTILRAGVNQPLNVTFTPNDIANYNSPVTASASITVTQATPRIVWNTPAPIQQGTPLGSTQLNASAFDINNQALAGTFVYNPPAGTVLPPGNTTLSTTFSPTDSTNYISTTASVVQAVSVISTTTSLSGAPNPATFGSVVTLTAIIGSGSSASAPLSGTVDFFDGTLRLGTSNITNGSATLQVNLKAGTHTLSANYSGDTNYAASSATGYSQVVNQATPTITWAAPANIVYGTQLSSAQLNAQATDGSSPLPGTYSYTPPAGTVLSAGTQTLAVTFNPTDSVDYTSTSARVQIVVTRATPTIVWPTPAPIPAGTALSSTQLNATATGINSAALPGTFTYNPPAGTVPPAGSTPLRVSFTPNDTVNYSAATASVVQVVNAATYAVALASTPNPSTYGQNLSLTATVTSNNTGYTATGNVTFYDGTALLGTAPIAGTTATLQTSALTAGTHNLTAGYTSSDNVTSTSAVVPQTVNPATPTINWSSPATIVYGTPLSAAQLNAQALNAAGAPIAGSYTYTPPAGTILTAGIQRLNVSFTPADVANYTSATGQTTVTVTQATPSINWPAPSQIPSGAPLTSTQLNASASGVGGANLPGTFVYNPPAGTILPVGPNTLNVSFTPTDTVNYRSAAASVQITVTTAQTVVSISSSANPSTFSQPVTLTATITSANTSSTLSGTVNFNEGTNLLGTATVANGAASITTSTLSAGAHSITATYSGNQNFAANTSAAFTQTVGKAGTTLNWPTPASIVYGTPLSATQLNASATTTSGTPLPGTYVYTPPAGTILGAGNQALSVTFTPTDSASYKTMSATVNITVTRATPTITWTNPADVVAGTTLSATQLNATATGIAGALPGTFTYNPPAGTALTAGQKTLNVIFSPTDAANYNNASASVTINVIALTLSTVTPNSAQLGDPDTTITLTGTGFLANSAVLIDGTAVKTTYVSPTQLTAIVPASAYATVHTITVAVNDPTQAQTSNTLNITIKAAPLNVTITGPTTTTVGAQPTVTFNLTNPYPVPLTATFTLTFIPLSGLTADPAVLFSNGTPTYTITIPAGATSATQLQIQTGSVAGTILISSSFSAGGTTVTPTGGTQGLTITSPPAVPGITTIGLTRNGSVLTVIIHGYSNTRAVDHVTFHFNAASAAHLSNTDITVDGATLFAPYFASPTSQPYGSTFTYTQDFNIDGPATDVASVQVTVANAVGASPPQTTQ